MAKSNLRHKANNAMTTAEKADKVFQSGLGFRIWNKPVQDDQIWDIRIFWLDTFLHINEPEHKCPKKGFKNLNDCLDDILKYLEEHNNE